MWTNFRAMPLLLKVLTLHAIGSAGLLVVSIVPTGWLSIGGRPVTLAEWWTIGTGVWASAFGLLFPFAGIRMLAKARNAPQVYLLAHLLLFVVPIPAPVLIGPGLEDCFAFVSVIFYFAESRAVHEYFGENPLWTPAARARGGAGAAPGRDANSPAVVEVGSVGALRADDDRSWRELGEKPRSGSERAVHSSTDRTTRPSPRSFQAGSVRSRHTR